jgi:hypothetical protein
MSLFEFFKPSPGVEAMKFHLPFAFQTDETGLVNFEIPIPGVFTGFTPSEHGRSILSGYVKFDNPSPGDVILAAGLKDPNRYLPAEHHAKFPGYPILGTYLDPATPVGVGLPMSTSGATTNLIELFGGPIFIPGGLVIFGTAKRGLPVQDWFRGALQVIYQLPRTEVDNAQI